MGKYEKLEEENKGWGVLGKDNIFGDDESNNPGRPGQKNRAKAPTPFGT